MSNFGRQNEAIIGKLTNFALLRELVKKNAVVFFSFFNFFRKSGSGLSIETKKWTTYVLMLLTVCQEWVKNKIKMSGFGAYIFGIGIPRGFRL